jgi:hypothetical protein
LVRVFVALEKALVDLTEVSHASHTEQLALRKHFASLSAAFSNLEKASAQSDLKLGKQVNAAYLAVLTLTDTIRSLITSQSIETGAIVDAKNALNATRENLERAVADVERHKGEIFPEDAGGPAPHIVRVWVIKLTNIAWPYAVKFGVSLLLMLVGVLVAAWRIVEASK